MRTAALFCLAGCALSAFPGLAKAAVLSPYVVDATGKTMGPLLSGNQVILTLPSRRLVQAPFYQTGFTPPPDRGPGSLKLYFTTTDCSGTPYAYAESLPPRGAFNPAKPTALVYPDADAVRIDYRSYRDIISPPPNGCFAVTGSMLAGRAHSFPIDSLNFTPPFSIKLQ